MWGAAPRELGDTDVRLGSMIALSPSMPISRRMRAVLPAKVVRLIDEAAQLGRRFSVSRKHLLPDLPEPEGMDMMMALPAPKSRLAMDITGRG